MKYIKLFEEHNYSIYELITMSPYKVHELFAKEIKKEDPDLELIRDILAYTIVDVNGKDSDGWTALIVAARMGNEKGVELLLNYPGIDVNIGNRWGTTALMIAADEGKEKPVELLLSQPGIDVNVQRKDGWTALMYAVSWGREKCVKLLLNHPGIDRSLKTEDDKTAWDLASNKIRQQFPGLNPDAI
jgi:ankyrin repeat protein